jgi:hypothetical protein
MTPILPKSEVTVLRCEVFGTFQIPLSRVLAPYAGGAFGPAQTV